MAELGNYYRGVPLVVGVTGHRDLRPQDLDSLASTVRGIFEGLRKDYPMTDLLLLSPLAEGADRLVARIALEAGCDLVAPIPLPVDDYKVDFDSDLSKAEFDELASKAIHVFQVTGLGEGRDACYLAASVFVVRHSDILIALWDGDKVEALGGTSQTVRFCLEGVPAEYVPGQTDLDDVETGPVYHVLTPHQSLPNPSGMPYSLTLRFPGDQGRWEERFRLRLQNLETYNADVGKLTQLGFCLVPDVDSPELPTQAIRIGGAFQVANALARKYQHERLRALGLSIGFVLFAIVAFETYADLGGNPVMGTLYPLALAVALIIYQVDLKRDHLRRHLDYRALCEGLRVQFYWSISGVKESAADEYLRQHRSELDWIRSSLRSLTLVAQLGGKSETGTTPALIEFVRKRWVLGQSEFYSGNVTRVRASLDRQERQVDAAFKFGFGVSILLCLAQWVIPKWTETWRDSIIWFMVVIPALAAVAETYADKLASYEQTRRYACMTGLFGRAAQRLSIYLATNDLDRARNLLHDLGKEALEENGNWVVTRRDRELDPPEAG